MARIQQLKNRTRFDANKLIVGTTTKKSDGCNQQYNVSIIVTDSEKTSGWYVPCVHRGLHKCNRVVSDDTSNRIEPRVHPINKNHKPDVFDVDLVPIKIPSFSSPLLLVDFFLKQWCRLAFAVLCSVAPTDAVTCLTTSYDLLAEEHCTICDCGVENAEKTRGSLQQFESNNRRQSKGTSI